jgi:hypothetical protein
LQPAEWEFEAKRAKSKFKMARDFDAPTENFFSSVRPPVKPEFGSAGIPLIPQSVRSTQ